MEYLYVLTYYPSATSYLHKFFIDENGHVLQLPIAPSCKKFSLSPAHFLYKKLKISSRDLLLFLYLACNSKDFVKLLKNFKFVLHCTKNGISKSAWNFEEDDVTSKPTNEKRLISGSSGRCDSPKIGVIFIKLKEPLLLPLDLKWNYRLDALVQRRLEVDKAMWWMSTLGGGYSALGDQMTEFALRAGKMSIAQLKLAFTLGDPMLVARCKLYIALSWIQLNHLKAAKKLIRDQYNFALQHGENARTLKNICIGVWSKLQYAYLMKSLNCANSEKT